MTQTHPAFDMASLFRALGNRIRLIRLDRGWKQEDMYARGFSLRHWQFIEEGRPITVRTLVRIALPSWAVRETLAQSRLGWPCR